MSDLTKNKFPSLRNLVSRNRSYAQLPAGTSDAATPLAQAEASKGTSGSLPKPKSLLNLRAFGRGSESAPPPVPELALPPKLERSTMLKGRGTRDRTTQTPPPSPVSDSSSPSTGPKVKFHSDVDSFKGLKGEFNPRKVDAKLTQEMMSTLLQGNQDKSRKVAKPYTHTPKDQELWKTPGTSAQGAVGPREPIKEKREPGRVLGPTDRGYREEFKGMLAKGGGVDKHGKSAFPKPPRDAVSSPSSSSKTPGTGTGTAGRGAKGKGKDQGPSQG